MSFTKLLVGSLVVTVVGSISSSPRATAQGISEMGATHAMGATLGAGLHSNVGATTGGLNSTYGSLNKQMNNLTGGSSGSSGSGGSTQLDVLGSPVDPRITVRDAGKESNHLYDMAVQKQRAGKNLEAEQLYRRSLAIRQNIWGAKDPAVPRLMSTIAELMRKRGDLAGAETCYQNLLKLQLKSYGAGAYELVPVLEKLGVLCYDQKKYAESENFLQQVYIQRSRKNGFDNAETMTAALELAKTRVDSNDLSGAAEVLKRCADAKTSDNGSPQMVKILEAYVTVLKKQNKTEELAAVESKLTAMKPGPLAKTETTDLSKVQAGGSNSVTEPVKTDAKVETAPANNNGAAAAPK